MSDPYWPWWAVILFFSSGAWCAWLATIAHRPGHVECPNCDAWVRTNQMREHWKVCVS
jgi:hypothetical protein